MQYIKTLILLLLTITTFAENMEKRELFLTMSDGVKLATDLYLPDVKEPVPVVLVRTPYNKNGAKNAAERLAKQDIAVVVQDCRGRSKSEGEFYPIANERKDGLETLRWVREQSWCNGKVGGWGGSYVGYTQWAISDSLDVFTPHLTSADFYGLVYPGGVFSLKTAFDWGLIVSAKKVDEALMKGIIRAYSILPLGSADDSVSYDVEFINDWIKHDSYDAYWENLDHSHRARAPFLSVAGWYDIFLLQQLLDFEEHTKSGHTDNRLVIGPWCHGAQGIKKSYGGQKKTGNIGQMNEKYLVKHLKDPGLKLFSGPFHDKKYNLFIMERNEYAGSDTWPPKETVPTRYFLGPDNHLSTESVTHNAKAEYSYDPADPYPSFGGTALGQMVGPAVQNANNDRTDQLVFETPALDKPLTLLGNISAELYLSSEAACTDFMVCLQDVFPNDTIINIQEGAQKVEFGGSGMVKKEINIWATGYELKKGHKLRVVITSSWFPRFNRSLNTCEPAFTATETNPARQTVHFGPDAPSHLVLPVYTR